MTTLSANDKNPIDFDPNAAASDDSGIFGLPFTYEEAKLVYLPVPWDVTTSYRAGTANGPKAIVEASRQIDLFDGQVSKPYEVGLHCLDESNEIINLNHRTRLVAEPIIRAGGDLSAAPALQRNLNEVNRASAHLNQWVKEETAKILKDDKIAALIGGDHSTPLGAFHAVAEKFGEFSILHFDAHSDTRKAFEGFQYSHASIMNNALEEVSSLKKLVQIGIRDFCEAEFNYTRELSSRVTTYYDISLAERQIKGETWAKIAAELIQPLTDKVWISFDIDALDPKYCPNTGTPVPGGLSFYQACYVVELLAKSGREIIGFDLNEVAPGELDEWDANVGSRLLYKLTGWTLVSQGLRKPLSN